MEPNSSVLKETSFGTAKHRPFRSCHLKWPADFSGQWPETVDSLSASRGNSEHFHHASQHLHWQSLPIYQATSVSDRGDFSLPSEPGQSLRNTSEHHLPVTVVNKLVVWNPIYHRRVLLWIWEQTLHLPHSIENLALHLRFIKKNVFPFLCLFKHFPQWPTP